MQDTLVKDACLTLFLGHSCLHSCLTHLEHLAVLLCNTKFSQIFSKSTFHKNSKNYFLILLYTTKLAPSNSQYYFVLQSLHKALPSTTLYGKPCASNLLSMLSEPSKI